VVLLARTVQGDGQGEYPPPADGDWIIGKNTYVGNETIELNGNLIVNRFGSLTLKNVTLVFMNQEQGQYGIEVRSEGTLRIMDLDGKPETTDDRTIIKSSEKDRQFKFLVKEGADFLLKNSEVSNCGYDWGDDGKGGLTVKAKNSRVENTNFHHCYNGLYILSEFNTIIGCRASDNEFYGIYVVATNNDIKNCIIQRNVYGIYVSGSNSNITGCQAYENDLDGITAWGTNIAVRDCNASYNGDAGIELASARNCVVLNCEAVNNGNYGLYQDWYSQDNNYIRSDFGMNNNSGMYVENYFGTGNITKCNAWGSPIGFDLSISGMNIKDSRAWNNTMGMRISGSNNNIKNCTSSGNEQGFSLQGFSNSNIFTLCHGYDNSEYDFFSQGNSNGNTFTDFISGSMPISFFYGDGIGIGTLPNPPPDPADVINIGKYLNINNVTSTSWINLNIRYTDAEIDGMLESTLRIYRFGKNWEEVPGSTVNEDGNFVNANISTFSPFAVMGESNPLERTVENLDTGETFYFIQDAIDAPTTKDGHTIKVHPRTYEENVKIYKEVDIIGDPLIEAGGGIGIWIQVSNVHVENMEITNGSIGVYIYNQSQNISGITLDNITAHNNNVGIHLWRAHENTLTECNVSGSKELGFYLQEANKNTIANARASDIRGDGVNLENANDNTIRDLTASNNNGKGVEMDASDGNLLINILAAGNDKGFHLYHCSGNTLVGCSAVDNDYEGFYIHSTAGGVANSNELIDCKAISNENGISIYGDRFSTEFGSNFNVVRNCDITDNEWNGIWLWGADFTEIEDSILLRNDGGIDISYTSSNTLIANTRIIESGDIDIGLRNDAMDSVAVNSTFNVVSCDESSSLIVRNFLNILARDALSNPLTGADVQVKDDNEQIYATPHYGGEDSRTDEMGMVNKILATDRGYFGSSTATEINTNVSVYYGDEELSRDVPMDTSHLEEFNFRFKIDAIIDSIDPDSPFEGESVTFSGHGTPPDRIVRYVWRSDLDDELYNGSEDTFTLSILSPGDHVIFLRVQDEQGSWSEEVWQSLKIVDIPPTAAIQSIDPSPANEGDLVTFTGIGIDGQGDILEYQWSSSLLEEPLNGNATFSTNSLPPGNHTITLIVRDNEGSWSLPASVELYINALPTAVIESIDPSAEINEGDEVEFIGSGSDPNGTIVAYEWTSSIQGSIGNTSNFSTADLAPGNHTITLRVRDEDGAWSPPSTWRISIIGAVVAESDDWFIIETHSKDDDKEMRIEVGLTPLGKRHLGEIASVRLWIDSQPLEQKLLFDSEGWGQLLFDEEDLTLSAREFRLNGTLKSQDLPNDQYTIRAEALADRSGNVTGPRILLNATEMTILLEHPRNAWGPLLGGAGVSVMIAGAGELLRGKGGAAEGAAVEGETKPFRLRSKIKKKLLKKNPLLSMLTFVVAVTFLVLAFGYTMMVSPTSSPGENMDLFDSVVLSNRSVFFGDLFHMLPYLLAVMGVILLFRLWVDWLASKAQGIESAFRPHFGGLVSLCFSTTLFGTPYGYPAQSIRDSQPGHGLKEARIAGARIIGLLVLLLPFWAAWEYLEEYRFFNELGLWLVLMCAFIISLPLGGSEGKMVWKQNPRLGLFLLALTAGLYFGWQMLYLPNSTLPIIGAGAAILLPLFLLPAPAEEPLEQPKTITPPQEVPIMLPTCYFCGNPLHENAVPCPICSSPMHDIDPKALYAFFMENMRNTNPRIRSATLTAMGSYLMQHRELQSMVEGALSDNDGQVRQAALRTLAPMISEQGELVGVIGNLIDDAFPIVRQAAIEVLTPFLPNNEFLFPAFQRNLFDMDEYVRGTAIQALAPFLPEREELLEDFRNLMDDHLDSIRSVVRGAVSPLFSINPWLKDFLFGKGKEEVEEETTVKEPQVPSRICPGCGQPMEIGWRTCPYCSTGSTTGVQRQVMGIGSRGLEEGGIDEIAAYVERVTNILGFNIARNLEGIPIDGGRAVVLTDFEGEELVVHTGNIGLQWVGSGLSVEMEVDSSDMGRELLKIFISPDLMDGESRANVSLEGSREVLDRWGETLQQAVWEGALDTIGQGEFTISESGGFAEPFGIDTSGWQLSGVGSFGGIARNVFRISGFVLGGRSSSSTTG